ANPGLDKIFDREKEQRRVETVQAVVDIGLQASDIVRTQGQIAGEKAKLDPKLLAAAKTQLEEKARQNGVKTAPGYDDIAKQAYTNAMAPWGTGSALQQGISAATAAASALAGGNVAGAVAGGAAPYLAELIHKATTTTDANGKEVVNVEANLIAHAVLGAAVAQASGGSALAGASGGAAGEYIAQQLYPGVDRADLSEEERQTISALGTLAAGLAGGLAGDSAGAAVTGAQAGKNAVENNNLAVLRQGAILAAEGCTKIAACRNALFEKGLGSLLGIGTAVTVLDKLSDTDKEYLLGVAATGRADLIEKLTPEQRAAYDYMVAQDQKGLVTIFPAPDKPLTIGSLENPLPENRRGTTLTTPDQRRLNGATNTGNTEGAPDTGGNTTVTPVPNGPNKDDLAYLSTGENIARKNANEPIRFIDGVNVRDIKTGENFSGTVDLKPTLDRIQTGGAYPHRNDGTTFQNRPDRVTGETGLPPQQPGYYKEYVHPTPGISGPGPQRIVVGQKGETYYTNDHYKTFIRIK
ncbi:VENN motif pre-toxin domain-containing protein, partial [Erwinia sp. 198]|uniref:VENN motif pre-toxin domain-containing protein n=1 Tax=Erwinia sp. 198 TaxID=2022746 RepID=UPI000F9309E5